MKIFLTLLLMCCITAGVFAQKKFEGVVTYSATYKSHIANVTDDQIRHYFGATQLFYVKGANSKYEYPNSLWMKWSLFVPKEKRVYDMQVKSDSALWYSVVVDHDTIAKTELKKNDTTILGYPCDRVTFTSKDGMQQVYYYNAKFAIDPELYADFKEVNYYDYLKIAKAVALKVVFIGHDFTETMIATEIKPMPLDDKLFELPPGINIGKNNQRD